MPNFRNLATEDSSLDSLDALFEQPFDFDVIDYVVLSRLEAKKKLAAGEAEGTHVQSIDPDTICIHSHYAPYTTKVYHALLMHRLDSEKTLSADEKNALMQVALGYV